VTATSYVAHIAVMPAWSVAKSVGLVRPATNMRKGRGVISVLHSVAQPMRVTNNVCLFFLHKHNLVKHTYASLLKYKSKLLA
jgi:hypothetical protein